MFHNRRHEIQVDFKAAPSFTDVPFPYHHSEETSCPLVWARKEKGKRKRERTLKGCSTNSCCPFETAAVSSWVCFSLQHVSRLGKLYLSWSRKRKQAAQRSCEHSVLKLYNYQLPAFLMISTTHSNADSIDLQHLIKRDFFHHPFPPLTPILILLLSLICFPFTELHRVTMSWLIRNHNPSLYARISGEAADLWWWRLTSPSKAAR